ncbi:MAG: hypothetical protein RL291_610 [Pseudomonadota bacterium]
MARGLPRYPCAGRASAEEPSTMNQKTTAWALTVMRFAAAAVALLLLTGGFGAVGGCSGANAADCASDCKSRYGQCYKSSQNRTQCDAALHRCLMGCR